MKQTRVLPPTGAAAGLTLGAIFGSNDSRTKIENEVTNALLSPSLAPPHLSLHRKTMRTITAPNGMSGYP